MSQVIPLCPEDCSPVLPTFQFSECAPETNAAQIRKIYMFNPAFPLVDWTSPAEWAARISNTSNANNAIREITVIGSKPKPESTEKKISGSRIIKGKKNHSLILKVDETNQVNYEHLVRELECGGDKSIIYATENYLYGGNDGVTVSMGFDDVIDEDETALEIFDGDAKWSSKFHPERTRNIIA